VSEGVPASELCWGEVVVCGSTGEPTWRKAKRCDSGQCVEMARRGESILIRSSVDHDGTYITLSGDEWQEFLSGVKNGDFDSL